MSYRNQQTNMDMSIQQPNNRQSMFSKQQFTQSYTKSMPGGERSGTYTPIPNQPGFFTSPEGHRYKRKRPGYYQPADPVGPNYYKPPQTPVRFDPTMIPRIPNLLPGIIPFI